LEEPVLILIPLMTDKERWNRGQKEEGSPRLQARGDGIPENVGKGERKETAREVITLV